MKEIKNSQQLNSHIINSFAKDNIYFGEDNNGKYIVAKNIEPITIKNSQKSQNIPKNTLFKIYQNNPRINFTKDLKGTKPIKFENSEISEHIKLPEKEEVFLDSLIKEINDNIRNCKHLVQQMETAAIANDEVNFKKYQSELKKEFHKLHHNATVYAANRNPENLYSTAIDITNVNNEILKFDTAIRQEIVTKDNISKIEKEIRENPYAIHLKAMMDMKENLGNDEILGTISNVNGVVAKSGYGDKTRQAMYSADKSQKDPAIDILSSGSKPPIDDTIGNTSVDVEALLDEPLQQVDYGKFLNNIYNAPDDDRLPGEKEKTLI